ncbi:unnamed protein product [Soboliphyme baturini]|uniref:Smad anchor for receptor activation-like C-terminal domain-containing protein n=1 Tax=Soboliphyme baturini TaxID=241478 RepID=A0A3P8DSC9_9BILA|nr:unnamed protein product [Soboliphyme baturini]
MQLIHCHFRVFSVVDGIRLSDTLHYSFAGQHIEKAKDRELLRLLDVYVFSESAQRFSTMIQKIAFAIENALMNFASELRSAGLTLIGVRVCVAPDLIEYKCGSCGKPLPDAMLPAMDDVLIPLLQMKLGEHCSTWSAEFVFAVIHV